MKFYQVVTADYMGAIHGKVFMKHVDAVAHYNKYLREAENEGSDTDKRGVRLIEFSENDDKTWDSWTISSEDALHDELRWESDDDDAADEE